MKKTRIYKSVSELPPVYVPVEEIERDDRREADAADRRYGPRVPALIPRGRPRKGARVEKSASHSVRMAESVRKATRRRVKALGISTNAATLPRRRGIGD